MSEPVAATGALAREAVTDLAGAIRLFVGVFARLLNGPFTGGAAVRDELVRQIYFTGVQGLLATTLVASLVGAITTGQLLLFLSGPSAQSLLGVALRLVVVRELAPVLAATIVVARSASAIAVDLGNMVQRGEIEALEGMGIDPIRFIVLPRVLGVAVSTVALCIVFDVYAIVAGMAVARELVGFPVVEAVRTLGDAVEPGDFVFGAAKSLAFGLVIGVVATQEGLGMRRSLMDIPRRTGRAVIATLLFCLALDAVLTVLSFRLAA